MTVAGMGMEMPRDLAHDPVDGETILTKTLVARGLQRGHHVGHLPLIGVDSMAFPHHHGAIAGFAVSHPADLVLVIPVRETGRLAQLTVPGGHLRDLLETPVRHPRHP